jgi:large subunit ribosomal protein L30
VVSFNAADGPHSKAMANKAENLEGGKIKIQYYRSMIGYSKKQKEIVKSLGITKLNQTIERVDTPSTRGVVAKIPHLLRIVE